MINLRYHIVSLTAVLLALGIGITMGSTLLDRVTVDSLNGQLRDLEGKIGDRDERIAELESRLDGLEEVQSALDEQGTVLLGGALDGVPVLVVRVEGIEDAVLDGTTEALVASGADLQGVLVLTERFVLDDGSELDELAEVLAVDPVPAPDRPLLRQRAVDRLAGEILAQQMRGAETTATTPGDPTTATTAPADAGLRPLPFAADLVQAGFVEFEAVAGGPTAPALAPGTRLLLLADSPDVPSGEGDVEDAAGDGSSSTSTTGGTPSTAVGTTGTTTTSTSTTVAEELGSTGAGAADLLVPFVRRLARGGGPAGAVLAAAPREDGSLAPAVATVRADEQLRTVVTTVDRLDHFDGWAAVVRALSDAGDGVVGHYGSGEGATVLLPPVRTP